MEVPRCIFGHTQRGAVCAVPCNGLIGWVRDPSWPGCKDAKYSIKSHVIALHDSSKLRAKYWMSTPRDSAQSEILLCKSTCKVKVHIAPAYGAPISAPRLQIGIGVRLKKVIIISPNFTKAIVVLSKLDVVGKWYHVASIDDSSSCWTWQGP